MARILILFAHPALERSRVHRELVRLVPAGDRVTFHDLYEAYPAFDIDVPREQELLLAHDVLVVQHPFYWYSTPPIVKQWEDLVLEHGWAYGSQGRALHGKLWLSVITAGGGEHAYRADGHNRYTVPQLLAPLEQTARLCGMTFLPPYVLYGTHRMTQDDRQAAARDYRALLEAIRDDALAWEAIPPARNLRDQWRGALKAGLRS